LENARLLTAGSKPCGRIRDVYFDDQSWQLKHLVAALDPRWHGPKQVLISPEMVDRYRGEDDAVLLALRLEDLQGAPPASSVLTVCKQYASLAMSSPGSGRLSRGLTDPHLRSARATQLYTLQAHGECAGTLADFLFDPASREIRYLAVEQAIDGRQVRFIILPSAVERFSWATQRIHLKHLQPVVLEDPAAPLPAAAKFLVA
jgi:hypothetical protein